MDALILAAGYGMRMDNLTKDIPKPLLKIKNKTLISYAIDLIKNMSFDKIYINTHYKHNMLERFISENYPDITISYEETILGTGGGIKNIQTNDTVILNTDNLWDQSFENELEKSIKFFDENKSFDSVLLINSKNNNFDLEVNNEVGGLPLCEEKYDGKIRAKRILNGFAQEGSGYSLIYSSRA